MLTIRRSDDRGRASFGWLDSRHTFSFGEYYDPAHMGFGPLRVINEDRVRPGAGFGTHGHRDMEIISYVLEGELEHKDSMGTGSVIRPGDVQRMTAGTGVQHSEFNHSKSALVHFLQIWVFPNKPGLPPGYEQKMFSDADKRGKLVLVASPDGRDGSLTIHADAQVYAGILAKGDRATVGLANGRGAWIHVARGTVRVNGQELVEGDGAAIEDRKTVEFEGVDQGHGEVLVFDLA